MSDLYTSCCESYAQHTLHCLIKLTLFSWRSTQTLWGTACRAGVRDENKPKLIQRQLKLSFSRLLGEGQTDAESSLGGSVTWF